MLKGALAETALCCLLREAGYRMAACSVETLVPPLRQLGAAEYLTLGPELRLLPDFLVVQPGGVVPLEVKYRTAFDLESVRKLLPKLREQQGRFPSTYTVLARGSSPAAEGARADDLVRVLPPGELELLGAAPIFGRYVRAAAIASASGPPCLEPLWQSLEPLPAVFERLKERPELMEALVPVLRALAQL